MAEVYMEKEKFAKAVPLLEQLVKSQPTVERYKTQLATAQEKAGK